MSHSVTPTTKRAYANAYREATRAMWRGRGMHTFAGACPMCGKPVGHHSGQPIYTNRDGSEILTGAEALAADPADVRLEWVGPSCFKKLGADYKITRETELLASVRERFWLTGDGKIGAEVGS